jgi:hypothetical protein
MTASIGSLVAKCNDRGAPYHDFPENGWDKLMALNVKSIFYSESSAYITLRLC